MHMRSSAKIKPSRKFSNLQLKAIRIKHMFITNSCTDKCTMMKSYKMNYTSLIKAA